MIKRDRAAIAVCLAPAMVVIVAMALRPAKVDEVVPANASAEAATRIPHVLPMTQPVPTATVSGRVIDEDAHPISAAQVCIACASCEPIMAPPPRCNASDAQGTFTLTDVAPGGQRVTAEAEGYAPGVATPDIVWVKPGSLASDVQLVLRPGGDRVVGSVMDASGGPVSHASVRAIRVLPPAMTLLAETDDDGRFALSLPAGSVTLEASAEGYAPTRVMTVAPSQAITLRLTPASRITGHVLDTNDNRAVAGIEVRAAPSNNPYAPIHRVGRSDHDGAFVIDGLEPGYYALTASGPGFRGTRPEPVEVLLADVVRNVDVRVMRAVSVAGRVIDRQGVPCQRGFATMGPPGPEQWLRHGEPIANLTTPGVPVPALMTMIGMNGEVVFEAATPGRYFVSVQCFDHVLSDGPEEIVVAQQDVTDLAWHVAPGLGLRVAMRDSADLPVPHAAFYLRFPTQAGRTPVMPMMTGDDGAAVFPGFMRPGTYQVTPAPPYVGDPVTVELRDGNGTAEVTLRIKGSGAIVVDAQDQDGVGVDQLQVGASVLSEQAEDSASAVFPATALGGGRYRIAPLVAGTYQVHVTDGVNAWDASDGARDPVTVSEGSSREVAIRIDRAAQIAGSITDDMGDPLANVWVSALATQRAERDSALSHAPPSRVLTDLDGHFVLSGLATNGSYRVRAEDPTGGVATVDAAAGATNLRIALSANSAAQRRSIALTSTPSALALGSSTP